MTCACVSVWHDRPASRRSAEDLSKASGVGTAKIYRIEKSDKSITGYASKLLGMQAALEQAGVEFVENDDIGGFGLRFSKKKKR
jgi:hypothetical protein